MILRFRDWLRSAYLRRSQWACQRVPLYGYWYIYGQYLEILYHKRWFMIAFPLPAVIYFLLLHRLPPFTIKMVLVIYAIGAIEYYKKRKELAKEATAC